MLNALLSIVTSRFTVVAAMMTAMSTNADLLEIEAAHAQYQADLLHGIAADLQEAVSILTSRAHHFEDCSQRLRTLLQTSTAATTTSHLSAKPSQEDALRTANAMSSTDDMVEILEQLKRDMEALTKIMCKPGATEQTDAKVYVEWKNSSRAHSTSIDDSILDKAAAISTLTGIKFSFPASIVPSKVRSTSGLAYLSAFLIYFSSSAFLLPPALLFLGPKMALLPF